MQYQGRLTRWYGSFGFIRFDQEQRDVFVHLRSFLKGFVPELDSIVAFDLGPAHRGDKKDQAKNVRIVKSAEDVIQDFQRQRALDLLKGIGNGSQGGAS
jgi:cold shock CspA family protein